MTRKMQKKIKSDKGTVLLSLFLKRFADFSTFIKILGDKRTVPLSLIS